MSDDRVKELEAALLEMRKVVRSYKELSYTPLGGMIEDALSGSEVRFDPDYTSHPCDTLDEMDNVHDAIKEAVRAMINGMAGLVDTTTDYLSKSTDTPRSFWRNRITDYFRNQCKEKEGEK